MFIDKTESDLDIDLVIQGNYLSYFVRIVLCENTYLSLTISNIILDPGSRFSEGRGEGRGIKMLRMYGL